MKMNAYAFKSDFAFAGMAEVSAFSGLEDERFTFPTGRNIRLADIDYEPATGVFTYGNLDMTGYLSRYQKEQFPAFDVEKDNALMSERYGHGAGADPGPTNLLALTAKFVGQDITSGAILWRNFVTGENLDPDTGLPRPGKNWLTLKNVAIAGGLIWIAANWKTLMH